MKTAIYCVLFFVVGAAAGAALTGYFVNQFHKGHYAFLFAGDLGQSALQAELIKQGDVAIVLNTLENSIPSYVIAIHENDEMRSTIMADTAMMATKRFYVCTATPIPVEIDKFLEPVSLPADACGLPR